MKKIISFSLISSAVLIFSGCGQKTNISSTPAQNQTPASDNRAANISSTATEQTSDQTRQEPPKPATVSDVDSDLEDIDNDINSIDSSSNDFNPNDLTETGLQK
jgi:PBP1b-binding outer membrane lipoprotein LpoB